MGENSKAVVDSCESSRQVKKEWEEEKEEKGMRGRGRNERRGEENAPLLPPPPFSQLNSRRNERRHEMKSAEKAVRECEERFAPWVTHWFL